MEFVVPTTRLEAERFSQQIDAELMRRDLREFVKAAWHLIEPITPLKWSWHFDAICQHLQAVTEGKLSRLLINIPPGSGKSSLISVLWPCWEMARRPSEKWLFFSHREDLADRDSVRRRMVITSEWYQALWPIDLRPDQNQKGMYTNMLGGSHLSSGTSAVTGFRGSRLCVASGTLVSTESGYIDVDTLHLLESPPRILTWNHEGGNFEYCKLRSSYKRPSDRRIVAVETVRGHRLECTEDHPIFTIEEGYREAALVRAGQTAICSDEVLLLQKAAQEAALPDCKGDSSERNSGVLLRKELLREVEGCAYSGESPSLPLREARIGKELPFLLSEAQARDKVLAQDGSLRPVPFEFSAEAREEQVLLARMRESFPRDSHAEGREFELQARSLSLEGVSGRNSKEGQELLCRLQVQGVSRSHAGELSVEDPDDAFCSSHQRGTFGQPSGESRDAVLELPRYSSQEETVSLVEEIRGAGEQVYDLTVEKNHNFFANGILVHNCLDDPNSTTEMMSELQRTSLLNWIDLQWSTRGNDGHVKVVIQQRSHEQDVTGHLLTQAKIEGGDVWCHLRIPMEYDPDTRCTTEIGWSDPRTTKGELMDPSRFTRDPAEKNKTNVVAEKIRLGSYGFSGQYQQEPTPFGGGIFKRAWLRNFDRDQEWVTIADGRKFNLWEQWRFATVDLAISTKDVVKNDPDYTVIAVWCVFQDHPFGPNVFLLDLIRERMEGPDLEKKIEAVAQSWQLPLVLVETIGYQASTAQSLIRKGVPVREASTRLDAAYRIEKDKTSRAIAATPLMENMRFWVPRYATWKADWESEHLVFPNGAHDDQVDCTSMAVGLTQKYGGSAMNWSSAAKEPIVPPTGDSGNNAPEVPVRENVYGMDVSNNPLSGFKFAKP